MTVKMKNEVTNNTEISKKSNYTSTQKHVFD